jgi:hypothetical protein
MPFLKWYGMFSIYQPFSISLLIRCFSSSAALNLALRGFVSIQQHIDIISVACVSWPSFSTILWLQWDYIVVYPRICHKCVIRGRSSGHFFYCIHIASLTILILCVYVLLKLIYSFHRSSTKVMSSFGCFLQSHIASASSLLLLESWFSWTGGDTCNPG